MEPVGLQPCVRCIHGCIRNVRGPWDWDLGRDGLEWNVPATTCTSHMRDVHYFMYDLL